MRGRVALLSGLSILMVGAVSWLAVFVVPQFKSVFQDFGAELPLVTILLLATYPWWWIMVPIVGALCWFFRTRESAIAAIFAASCGVSFLLFVLGGYACYAPIFVLGQS